MPRTHYLWFGFRLPLAGDPGKMNAFLRTRPTFYRCEVSRIAFVLTGTPDIV